MCQPPEATPPPLDRHDDVPLGLTVGPWAFAGARPASSPVATWDAATAECTCPTGCIRDHENE